MKKKETKSVSIIGGADGPTSVFIAGRTGKKPLKEVIAYANERFTVTEVRLEE